MTIKKSDSQIIIDAVSAMVIAMIENTSTEIIFQNSVIGMSPATLFINEPGERLAWICVHQGMICPQIFLARNNECDYVDAPVEGFNGEDGPQIFSPRFQRDNTDDGVCGFNMSHESFSTAVTEAAKVAVKWLIEGIR